MDHGFSGQDFSIDRHGGVSAWKQIADKISRSIQSGEFDHTGRVPPETVLAERFGVNRHTVRNALAALVEEGLLSRVQGRGTMIEKREKLVFPITRRTRFTEGLGQQAGAIAREVVRSDIRPARKDVAEALHLKEGVPLACIFMIGFADQQPVSVAATYFPEARFGGIGELISHHHSVTKALNALGVADYVRVSTDVTGRTASTEEGAYLKLSGGAVVLEAASVNADLDGVPIQYSRTVFAADRIALRFDTP
jgi:GntR family phosphonate transport system transcriptional regulator